MSIRADPGGIKEQKECFCPISGANAEREI